MVAPLIIEDQRGGDGTETDWRITEWGIGRDLEVHCEGEVQGGSQAAWDCCVVAAEAGYRGRVRRAPHKA